VNRILVSSFNQAGWGYKIPDPPQTVAVTSSKRPFDVIAVNDEKAYYIESKLIKGMHTAFNLSNIREHQIENLMRIRNNYMDAQALIAVFYWVPRKVFDVLFFDIEFVNNLLMEGTVSIKKKQILEYLDEGKYLSVKKAHLSVEEIQSVIIR